MKLLLWKFFPFKESLCSLGTLPAGVMDVAHHLFWL